MFDALRRRHVSVRPSHTNIALIGALSCSQPERPKVVALPTKPATSEDLPASHRPARHAVWQLGLEVGGAYVWKANVSSGNQTHWRNPGTKARWRAGLSSNSNAGWRAGSQVGGKRGWRYLF